MLVAKLACSAMKEFHLLYTIPFPPVFHISFKTPVKAKKAESLVVLLMFKICRMKKKPSMKED
jgi:hypothetical protein